MQVLEHLARAQVQRVEVVQKRAAQPVVAVTDRPLQSLLQPGLLLRWLPLRRGVMFPGGVGLESKPRRGRGIHHPGLERRHQCGQTPAVAQRVEYAVDENLMRIVALGCTQPLLQGRGHVGSGQGSERMAHPGFAAEPLVAMRRVAERLQQRQPIRGR